MLVEPRLKLREMFDAAVSAASPLLRVPAFLPSPPKGRTVVVGAGKASALMAKAVEDNWTGPLGGLVVTRDGHNVHCDRIEIVEASHPVPDTRGLRAAERIRALVDGLGRDDLVLALVSGGGSSLLTLPAPGLRRPCICGDARDVGFVGTTARRCPKALATESDSRRFNCTSVKARQRIC